MGTPRSSTCTGASEASVADAMEQLYGERNYMHHQMRPLAPAKFAGPAVTVLLKKEEHKQGAPASQGMLDAIDAAPPGSVYVMVLEDGADCKVTRLSPFLCLGDERGCGQVFDARYSLHRISIKAEDAL